ncbi:MAG: ABC transporter substrate-binding protein, partial [bacterium]
MLKLFILFAACISIISLGCTGQGNLKVIQWLVSEDVSIVSRELACAYMESHPAIEINIVSIPSSKDVKQEIDEHIDKKDINIITVNHEILEYLIEQHYIALIKSDWLKHNEQNYFKGAIKTCESSSDFYYAFPWLVDTSVLYYHDDHLKKIGLSPPFTW